MMTFNQILIAAKIEYHWWRIGSLRKKANKAPQSRRQALYATENLHRYKAEIASIEYEISLGLRNHHGLCI